MALDALAVMQHHGFDRFQVLAHDRGARVAHRLAVDHPQAVLRLLLLDIAPTLARLIGVTPTERLDGVVLPSALRAILPTR
jgi:haloacetate dehalogenase